MILNKININNFRGVKSAEIEGLNRFSLLVGRNNSGKTSVLESIFLSVGISNHLLPININLFRNLGQTEAEDFKFIFYQLDFNNTISIESKFSNSSMLRNLTITPKSNSDSRSEIKKSENDISSISHDTTSEVQNIHGINIDFSVTEKDETKKFLNQVFFEGNEFRLSADKNPYKNEVKGVFVNSGNINTPNLDKKLETLIVNRKHEGIVSVLNKIDQRIKDISLGTGGMIYLDIEGVKKLVPLNVSGDGIRRSLSLLVNIANSKDGIVLIDELENGLHFETRLIILKAIIEATKTFNVQVIATTHSYELLEQLSKLVNENENLNYKNEISAISIRRSKEDSLKGYIYNFDKLEYNIQQEIEIR